MDALQKFLDDWTERFTAALVAAIDDSVDDFEGSNVYAAAIVVTDGNTISAFAVNTEAHYLEMLNEADEDETDALLLATYRWWPQEWDFYLDTPEGDVERIADELGEWADAHPDVVPADVWPLEWLTATDLAFERALGSDAVRNAFGRHGSNPVLFVVDSEERLEEVLDSLEALNPGRDDDHIASAQAFWQAEINDDDPYEGDEEL